jgi:hypothetical protein
MTEVQQILYHYTTQQGFLGIVNTGSMWASSIQHLNDTKEFHYASDLVQQVLNETTQDKKLIETIWSNISSSIYGWDVFVTSFSADGGNELSQWRAYGHSGGFSIGFNVDALKAGIAHPSNANIITGILDSGYVLEKCSYNEDLNKAEIKTIVERAIAKVPFGPFESFSLLADFLALAPKLKHPAFFAEQEWRLIRVRQNPFSVEKKPLDICYRPGKSFFVPYIKFALTDSSNPKSLLPISKVWVGPTPYPELSVWNVRNCLMTKGVRLDGLKVEKSAVPYRDW